MRMKTHIRSKYKRSGAKRFMTHAERAQRQMNRIEEPIQRLRFKDPIHIDTD